MRRKTKKYSLSKSFIVNTEGVSIYKVIRDESDFSYELMEKYGKDVRELLNTKLEHLALQYNVPKKEVARIKELISELEKVAETKC